MTDTGAGEHEQPGRDEDPQRPAQQPKAYDPATMHFQGMSAPAESDFPAEIEGGLSTEDHATIEALRPGTALLLVLRGPNTGARFLLDAQLTTTGRHPDSDIFLDDVTVSRKHAVFQQEADGFVVRDVGSLNGTYVNRERIDSVPLRTGDEVQIGKFRLVYYTARRAN